MKQLINKLKKYVNKDTIKICITNIYAAKDLFIKKDKGEVTIIHNNNSDKPKLKKFDNLLPSFSRSFLLLKIKNVKKIKIDKDNIINIVNIT